MVEADWGPEERKAFSDFLCPNYFELEDED